MDDLSQQCDDDDGDHHTELELESDVQSLLGDGRRPLR